MNNIDYNKKGVIVIGSARSGSHMTCDMLYNQATAPSVNLGEITDLYLPTHDKFIFCSIVQTWLRTKLAVNLEWTKDYYIINLRRRDKVSQYISWCVLRAQGKSNMVKHSPNWEDYKDLLPWKSSKEDIERFIQDQHLDFAFTPDQILYYEDLVKTNLKTRYTKNHYPISYENIVTDYKLVKDLLEKYSYENR